MIEHDEPTPRTAHRVTVFTWSGALGDTLLLVPLLQAVRANLPDAHVTVFTGSDAGRLLVECGLAHEARPSSVPALAPLATGLCDDLAGLRSALRFPEIFLAFTNRPDPVRKALTALDPCYSVRPARPREGVHAAENFLTALDDAGIPTAWNGPSAVRAVQFGGSRATSAGPYVIHPGAGATWKCAPPDMFHALAQELTAKGARVVVLEGEADASQVRRMGWHGEIVRSLSLAELAQFLSSASGYAGNDSGVTHLAGLIGIPTLAMFGPTDPAVWGPLGPQVTIREFGDGS